MTRSIFSVLALAVAAGVGCTAPQPPTPKSAAPTARADLPNVVLILADNLGYGDLSVYGSAAIRTPVLDQLAADGARFTQAYAGFPVCNPSRATLMTGLHAGHVPIRTNIGVPLPDSSVTVAEVLKSVGYVTGGFGKWGLGNVGTSGAPEQQGFDLFFGYYNAFRSADYYPVHLVRNGESVPLPENARNGRGRFSHYLIVEKTLDFIEQNRNRPFFCYAAWTLPHPRYELPPDDPAASPYTDVNWPEAAKGHAAYVSLLDRSVGLLLERLGELDLVENTIVIFTSDNGPPVGPAPLNLEDGFKDTLNSQGPFRGTLGELHEGGIRVPLIIRWPGRIPAGSKIDMPCYFPDILPTLADLADASKYVPDDVDGIPLTPALTAGEQPRHDYMYWELYKFPSNGLNHLIADLANADSSGVAVRVGDWKIIRHDEDEPFKLFNVVEDPAEATDLANEHPEIVAELAELAAGAHVPPPPQVVL